MKLPVGLLWDEVMVTLQTFPSQNKGYTMETCFKMSFEQTGNFLQFPGKVGKNDDLLNMRTSEPA